MSKLLFKDICDKIYDDLEIVILNHDMTKNITSATYRDIAITEFVFSNSEMLDYEVVGIRRSADNKFVQIALRK